MWLCSAQLVFNIKKSAKEATKINTLGINKSQYCPQTQDLKLPESVKLIGATNHWNLKLDLFLLHLPG